MIGSIQSRLQEGPRTDDQYYVLGPSAHADHETRVLKQGETFAIFDAYGDLDPESYGESGLFYRGTRYLSKCRFTIFGARPLLLNSTLRDDNGLLKVDMTNGDLRSQELGAIHKGALYIHREKFLLDGVCLEQVELINYGFRDISTEIGYLLGADYADIFEVRGIPRAKRGSLEPLRREGERVYFRYTGLDGLPRMTVARLPNADFTLQGSQILFPIQIPAKGRISYQFEISFLEGAAARMVPGSDLASVSFHDGLKRIQQDHAEGSGRFARVRSSNEQFELWLRRSTDDLVMMTTDTGEGDLYPFAGIPWFCAPFGRDGVLTALECLWVNPALAKGVLRYLASTQSQSIDADRDATPGKIVHEVRCGEMASLSEVPFGRYYGSIDSTPLFVALAGAYYQRTADLETVKGIWPQIKKALQWMEEYGDPDKDGFIEYERQTPNGLIHQGWKDSMDCIFHENGDDARAPIALCEVQGYAYMAWIEAAIIAEALREADQAEELRKRAARLKERFDEAFWLDDLGTYALALDADKKPCRVKSSNAGQTLFTGIVKEERAERLAKTLLSPESFSGWGVRTIATDASRYNPMSYHNGSVWPHDVALIAWGLSRYGFTDEVERIFTGLFRAANYMELQRMPEVFCGFVRREGEAPTLYPHACAPQAWSAAAVYSLIQSLLGLTIDATQGRVELRHPRLPTSLESLRIKGLTIASGELDLSIDNYISDVSVQIARRSGRASVVVVK